MESAWSNGKPAYRCRHGHTSATPPDPGRARNVYVREDRLLPRLPALHLLLTGAEPSAGRRRRTRRGADARPAVSPEDVIGFLRENDVTLTWDQAAATLKPGTAEAMKTFTVKASWPGAEKLTYRKEAVKRVPVARRWREPARG
jgi:hypothetical protein